MGRLTPEREAEIRCLIGAYAAQPNCVAELMAELDALRIEKRLAVLRGRALELADVVKYARSMARAHAVLNRSMSHRSQAEALSKFADELHAELHRSAASVYLAKELERGMHESQHYQAEPRCADGTLIVEANDAGEYEP